MPMNRTLFDKAKTALRLAWEHDDLMTQETLFALQDVLASLALDAAIMCGQATQRDLAESFPFLYSMK